MMTDYPGALLSGLVSFEQALQVIREHGPIRASALARLLGLSLSAAWSVLWLLAAEGYLQAPDPRQTWSPLYTISTKGLHLLGGDVFTPADAA